MPSRTPTITRRAFLSAPTALAFSGALAPRSAGAVGSPVFDTTNKSDLAKAAVLSARHCARDGFFRIPWLPRLFEADLLLGDPILVHDVAWRAADLVAQGSFHATNFSNLALMTAPKNAHGARRVFGVMEPLDAVVYLALAVLAAPVIERNRIPARRNVVHSFRFLPGYDRLFDEQFNFVSFLAAARSRAMAGAYVINCDFANCYGSLGHDRIAAALEHCGVPAWQTAYISELLAFWQHRDSLGLPVGSNGSRFLAEAVLLRIDKALASAGLDFVRYVDDFRLFAADEHGARLALAAVQDISGSHGLFLNSGKTRIVHFVNAALESNDTSLSNPSSSGIREYRIAKSQSGSSTSAKRYGEMLPLNFRRASAEEIQSLRGIAEAPEAVPFLEGEPAPPSKLRRAIRRAIYAGHDEFVRAIPSLLGRYPEFSAYVASALSRTSDFVPGDTRNHLRTELAAMLLDDTTPDFVAMKLLDILAHPDYRDRNALEQFARARAVEPRGLCFRFALDALRNTGGVTPDLYRHFEMMDGWNRRALLADPNSHTSITLSSASADPFIAKLAT
jgi:hypothetical protein